MTREEIVTALRICSNAKITCNGCPLDGPDDGLNIGTVCFDLVPAQAADLIENQQREIDALRQANEGLQFNLADAQRRGAPQGRLLHCEGTPPYEATTDEPDGDEICRKAMETFGKSSQMQVAIEEMSELTKELCKNGRGQENTTHIAEEIADVEIMLQQMVMLFDCEGQVETFRRYKLERLAERIKEAKQCVANDM